MKWDEISQTEEGDLLRVAVKILNVENAEIGILKTSHDLVLNMLQQCKDILEERGEWC